jgi:hypothetical protein
LQATPAIAGYGLKQSGLRPALFFGAAWRCTWALGQRATIVLDVGDGADRMLKNYRDAGVE